MKISKKKVKKLFVPAAATFALAAGLTVCLLLFHRPGYYVPAAQISETNDVSNYLTHELGPQFYNGLQKRQPFEMVVFQSGVNEIISGLQYPVVPDSISIYEPAVSFSPDGLHFICAAQIKGVRTFITVLSMPCLDADGLLSFNLSSVKIGAVPITPFIRPALEGIITDIVTVNGAQDDFGSKIALAMLENKPFDPVFTLYDKEVRITGLSFEHKKLTINFTPVN